MIQPIRKRFPLSKTSRKPPTFLEQIGTIIFHIRERSRLAVGSMFSQATATISTAHSGGIAADFFVQNKSDYIQRYLRAGEFFESSELELLRKNFKGGVFVDVGGNIGNHAIYFGKMDNCTKIIAFEPNPEALRILKINILLNRLDHKIELHEFALGNATAVETIAFSAGNIGGTSIKQQGEQIHAGQECAQVQVKKGDDVLKKSNVDLIKIDVEGYEIQVLRGLEKTIMRCRPTLFVEVWQENQDDFTDFLSTVKYRQVKRLGNGGFDMILAEPI
jgi:FkbM family methyltransferase